MFNINKTYYKDYYNKSYGIASKMNMKGLGVRVKHPLRPPICRIGSKIPIRDKVIKLIPDHKIYVEAFAGSGAIFWNKIPSEKEILNDLDSKLMNNYKTLKTIQSRNFEKDIDSVKEAQDFVNKSHTSKEDKLTKDILIACNTFGNKGVGKIYIPSNPYRKLKNIDKYQERLKDTTLLNKDYKYVIKKYDSKDTFFFLDPPYENSEDLYDDGAFNFEELNNILKSIKGKFMLTINSSPYIKKVFSSFKQIPIRVKGQGNYGIGLKDRDELLIINY